MYFLVFVVCKHGCILKVIPLKWVHIYLKLYFEPSEAGMHVVCFALDNDAKGEDKCQNWCVCITAC
jgi:hypothetical protein